MLMYYTKKACASLYSKARAKAYLATHPLRTDFPPPNYDAIWGSVSANCPEVLTDEYTVDPARFAAWVAEAKYPFASYVVNREEKYLEHQVSVDLLGLPDRGVLVDVASCRSWFPHVMRRRGYRVIAQDLDFPLGLHGDRLGGDAAKMDLPDAYADGLTLHCSFEHFEGDADSRFVAEAARVLKRHGRVVILPLYLYQEYVNMTDPIYAKGPVIFDEGAQVVATFGLANRYGRHYGIDAFALRVVQPAIEHGLDVRVVRILRGEAITPKIYLNFALVLSKR